MADAARQAAVAGVGYSDFSKESGRSVLALAAEAARLALADAGLEPEKVDGVASFSLNGDSVSTEAVATVIGARGLRYALDLNYGGQAPCYLMRQVAATLARGEAEYVVVFRALNGRSGARVGTGALPGPGAQYRYPIGYGAWAMYMAMWAKRYLHETGQGSEELGEVAVAQRRHAARNPRALLSDRPLDLETYLEGRFLVDPFRIPDCPNEVDGAVALLVTTLDRARDLRQPPAVLAGSAFATKEHPGLDIGDYTMGGDYSRNFTSLIRDPMYAEAGIGAGDVDLAEIYDCSTSTVLVGLEGLGFCGRGEAGEFVRSGATGLDGSLPVNTHGGLLAEGYLHGMNTLSEAVIQIQGRAGERQAPKHEVAAVTSGGYVDGSGVILTADR
jgi:acetyl-CoA acetyltransferase